jgi:iron complex transport system ATP-binding protein
MAKSKKITVIMSLHEIDLAMKVSDKIICVKGDHIFRYGDPDEIFDEAMLRDLYDIDNGYFDPAFGSIELPAPEGSPRAFVISSGGSGLSVYRRLQKKGIPFAAGILYPNDIDYQLARLLAAEVICEEPFMPITESTLEKAKAVMAGCEMVINAGVPIGEANRLLADLIREAEEAGKLKSADSL